MSGRLLLDTNIIIALFAKEGVITQKLTDAEEVFIPAIALGELYFGASKSARAKENATVTGQRPNSTVLSKTSSKSAERLFQKTTSGLLPLLRSINSLW